MSPFHVGMQVVCVDDSPHADGLSSGLSRGQVYTISGLSATLRGQPFVLLADINPRRFGGCGWRPERFRPVRKTDISIFTAMLAPKPKQLVEAAE